MAFDVFISYASGDKPVADRVCKCLEDGGIKCWMAPRDIRPGENYGTAIIQAINACAVMVVVFSSKSNGSQHVLREVERAVNKGPTIIPFRIEDVPLCAGMEYFISTTQWLDALSEPLDPHLEILKGIVRDVLSGKAAPAKAVPKGAKPPPPPELEWDDEEPSKPAAKAQTPPPSSPAAKASMASTPTSKAPPPARPKPAAAPPPATPKPAPPASSPAAKAPAPSRPAAPASTEDVALEHFLYGSYGGYTMKSKSAGVDPGGHTDPFKGMMLPIKQSDVKTMTEIRAILPCGWDLILLSRIIKGEKDDKGRGTIANHTAIIPRKMLETGRLAYEDIDAAMAKWEAVSENLGAVGSIQPLKVPSATKQTDLSELKNYMPKAVLDKLVENYKKDKERKVFVNYKNSNEAQRVKAAYLLSMLVDMRLRVIPLAIFTDVPYRADEASPFNLVLSRVMISIKPGGAWVVLTANTEAYGADGKKAEEIKSTLSDIYG